VSHCAKGLRGNRSVWSRTALTALLAILALPALAGTASAQQGFRASFTYSPAAPTADEPITFRSTSTTTANAVIVSEHWDFTGDGQLDSSGPSATYTFTSAGTHRVSLTVTDSRRRSETTSRLVTVASASAPAPAPAPPPPSPAPEPVTPPSPAPAEGPPPAPLPTTASSTASLPIVPFPVVRITGSYTRLGVRLQRLAVTAPVGVRITVRCTGRTCPYRRRGPFVVRRSATQTGRVREVRIRGFGGRLLRPGTRIEVFVAHPRRTGKYTYFRVRTTKPPARVDRCLRAGGSSAISCG
jgi:plastocyanin